MGPVAPAAKVSSDGKSNLPSAASIPPPPEPRNARFAEGGQSFHHPPSMMCISAQFKCQFERLQINQREATRPRQNMTPASEPMLRGSAGKHCLNASSR